MSQIGASCTNLSKGVLICPLQVALDVASQRPSNAFVQSMILAEGQGRILHNSTTLKCEDCGVSAWRSVARMMQLLSRHSRFVILPCMQLRCFLVANLATSMYCDTCGLSPSLSWIWSVRPSPMSTVVINMICLSLLPGIRAAPESPDNRSQVVVWALVAWVEDINQQTADVPGELLVCSDH